MPTQKIMAKEHIYDGEIGGFGWIPGIARIDESPAI
jgi:hypothetical protein